MRMTMVVVDEADAVIQATSQNQGTKLEVRPDAGGRDGPVHRELHFVAKDGTLVTVLLETPQETLNLVRDLLVDRTTAATERSWTEQG